MFSRARGTATRVSRMEVISLDKQVLRRQGTVPVFTSERRAEIVVAAQPDDRALCGGHPTVCVKERAGSGELNAAQRETHTHGLVKQM